MVKIESFFSFLVLFCGPSLICCKAPDSSASAAAARCRYTAAGECTQGEATVPCNAGLLSLPVSPSLPPPCTNPLTPDSENRWRGKWGFGAEEFTVSRETFTSIWLAHSTFWNPIVTFHSGVKKSSESDGWGNAFCTRKTPRSRIIPNTS